MTVLDGTSQKRHLPQDRKKTAHTLHLSCLGSPLDDDNMPVLRLSNRHRTNPSTAARDSVHPYGQGIRANVPTLFRPSATIQQGNGRQILKITTKPHRLRRAINADDASDEDGDQSIQATPPPGDNGSESDAATRPVPRAARAARNNKRPIVESPESESEDEEMEDDEDDEGQETSDEDSEDDAGGEDADNDEDELAAHPSAPLKKTAASGRSKISITVPPKGSLKSAEAKEQELNDDEDEELSELESPDIGNDNEGGDDGLDDSDEDEFSRSATPDLAKLTKRQRGHFVAEPEVGNLLALSNEAQKKKHLTAEEHAMRRAEMARRRKNLSEKRNEEEKVR